MRYQDQNLISHGSVDTGDSCTTNCSEGIYFLIWILNRSLILYTSYMSLVTDRNRL